MHQKWDIYKISVSWVDRPRNERKKTELNKKWVEMFIKLNDFGLNQSLQKPA